MIQTRVVNSVFILLVMMGVILTACGPSPEPRSAAVPASDSPPAAKPTADPRSEQDDRPVILAFGNSLTAGYGLPPGSGYPEQLQAALDAQGLRYRVVAAGVSGDTTSGGLVRLQSVLQLDPELVILELGANDGLRGLPIDQMRSNLDEMITAFQKVGARVVLAGMTLPLNYGADYVRQFENVYIELAEQHKLTLIPFFLEGVAGDPRLTLPDLMHPNRDGYAVVSRNVLRFIGPLLKSNAESADSGAR